MIKLYSDTRIQLNIVEMITMEAWPSWTQWSSEALQDDTQRQRDLGPWQRASAARPGEWPQCAAAQRLQPGQPTNRQSEPTGPGFAAWKFMEIRWNKSNKESFFRPEMALWCQLMSVGGKDKAFRMSLQGFNDGSYSDSAFVCETRSFFWGVRQVLNINHNQPKFPGAAMAGHGLYAGRWSQRWSCFSRCRSRRGHRQWLTTALRRGSVWARDMLGWWGWQIGWYYKFGEKVKSNQKVGKGGKIMNNQEFLTWILVGLHIVDPYRSYSHSPYSLMILMRPKYQHWAFAQDVVIGSGGAMLKRFVQALHFAKRCKDMGSEPKIETGIIKQSRSILV